MMDIDIKGKEYPYDSYRTQPIILPET